MEAVRGVVGLVAGLFLLGDCGIKLASCNLFSGGVDVAKLAGGKIVLGRAHGRPKGAAENGPMLVEVAGAMFKVEHRARLVIGELFEEDGSFVVFVEDAAVHIAGKPRIEAGKRIGNSIANSCGAVGVGLGEGLEAVTETSRVFMSDGEDANAALRASGFADKVMAAATIGISYRRVYDLNQRRH